jgi:hypothetical protein
MTAGLVAEPGGFLLKKLILKAPMLFAEGTEYSVMVKDEHGKQV